MSGGNESDDELNPSVKGLKEERKKLEEDKKGFEDKRDASGITQKQKDAYDNSAKRVGDDIQDLDKELIDKQIIQPGQNSDDIDDENDRSDDGHHSDDEDQGDDDHQDDGNNQDDDVVQGGDDHQGGYKNTSK